MRGAKGTILKPSGLRKGRRGVQENVTKGGVTRERIREAVICAVSRKGPKEVTLHDICAEAGITHGGFYFHFKNKEEAMLDVAQEWLSEFKSKVLATPRMDDFYDEVHGMVLAYVKGYTEDIQVTRLVYALDPKYTEVSQTFSRHQRRWWARLEELFIRTRRAMKLPTGMETIIVHSLTTSLEGVCVNSYLVRLPELEVTGIDPERIAESQAIVWHRAVLGRDPDPKKLRYFASGTGVARKT